MIRLLALVPSLYDTSPGQRFRIEQWEPFIRDAGISVSLQSFECPELHALLYRPGAMARKVGLIRRAFARRLALLRTVCDYDAVYVFREAAVLGPPVLERWIVRRGVPIVFDFDDAVFVRYVSPANGYLSWLKFPGKTAAICRWARGVMAGNEYLAAYARRVNRHVTVVPTTIDTAKYRVTARAEAAPPVIGWSGSYSTAQHLNTLTEILPELSRRESFRLRVIGAPSYRLPGVDLEALPWRSETEVADLDGIDVGLMPLPDDPWNRGKCGLKALQYMALGKPTVCSPVGVNVEIIEEGVNGFLAASATEWLDKLRSLLKSSDLRRRLGLAGRETVERRYSAAVWGPEVARLLNAVAIGRHDSSPAAVREPSVRTAAR